MCPEANRGRRQDPDRTELRADIYIITCVHAGGHELTVSLLAPLHTAEPFTCSISLPELSHELTISSECLSTSNIYR